MPPVLSYPGVYVQEFPSGVRTITGVATSITAFLGRAPRGPVNNPVTINSYADFENFFGGLEVDYPLSYAVQDFFMNGGGQAIIVRLFPLLPQVNGASPDGVARLAAIDVFGDGKTMLALEASSPGAWGNNLTATVQANQASVDVARSYGLLPTDLFDLTVADTSPGGVIEVIPNVTLVGNSPRRVDRVLLQSSTLVRVASTDAHGAPLALPEPPLDANKKRQPVKDWPAAGNGAATWALGDLVLEAAQPGTWANSLQLQLVTPDPKDPGATAFGSRYNLTPDDLFSLVVTDNSGARLPEQIPNVTVKNDPKNPSPRRVDLVLAQMSQTLRVADPTTLPTVRPTAVTDSAPKTAGGDVQAFTGGQDPGALDPSDYLGSQALKTGIYALDRVDLFNLLCIPPDQRDGDTEPYVYQHALQYCQSRRAVLIVDPPSAWSGEDATAAARARDGLASLGIFGEAARNGVLYFPRVREVDPLRNGQIDTFAPSGIVAGIMARTDVTRGVWKAPAGIDATLMGIDSLDVNLNDAENGMLNPIAINCLRNFPVYGPVVWGARTMRGSDALADDYKYLPVRRLTLYLEESLYRGLKWVVFEPNDEPLWSQIRLNVGAFMQGLFRQGAFQGSTPAAAYFVKCDHDTTTQDDINHGVVNIAVGFAPLKPAEFVVLQIQQIAGAIAT